MVVAKVVVAITATTIVVTVVVAATVMIAAGTQRTADERKQLLYVTVKLVGKTGNAATAVAVCRRDVSQYVRFKVHRLGVPLRWQQSLLVVKLLLLLQVRGVRDRRRVADV